MIPSTDLFHELNGPEALAPRVSDLGLVFVDLDHDQPPYVGMMLELDYRPHISLTQRQMFKLPIDQVRALASQLQVIADNEERLRGT